MSKERKGLTITAIVLTIVLIVLAVFTFNRWERLLEKETQIKEWECKYDELAETEAELLLELEELKQ